MWPFCLFATFHKAMSSNCIHVVACTGTVSFVAEYCHCIDNAVFFCLSTWLCIRVFFLLFAYYEYNYEHFVYMFSFLLMSFKHLMVLVLKFRSLTHFCMWYIVGIQFHSLICGYLVEQYLIVTKTSNNFLMSRLAIFVQNTYKWPWIWLILDSWTLSHCPMCLFSYASTILS